MPQCGHHILCDCILEKEIAKLRALVKSLMVIIHDEFCSGVVCHPFHTDAKEALEK